MKKNNIKVLRFQVSDDGDFKWNCTSYPRKQMEWGGLENSIVIYFKDASPTDIATCIRTIANEFKNSVDCFYKVDYFGINDGNMRPAFSFSTYVYDNLMETADEIQEADSLETDCLTYEDCGNYSMDLSLFDYIEESITFANTNEKCNIAYFDTFNRII